MTTNLHAAVKRRALSGAVRDLRVVSRTDLRSVGEGCGAWVVPERLLSESMACWCVGDGDDVSFASSMACGYGARVRFFVGEPSARSAAEAMAAEHPSFVLHEVAIAASDGPATRRSTPTSGPVAPSEMQRRRLDTLAEEFGEGTIDLLCLDLGGGECDVLDEHDLGALGTRILCLEMGCATSASRLRTTIDRLHRQGFDVVHRARPARLTFARRNVPRRSLRAVGSQWMAVDRTRT